jgi:hypothetical protein
LWRWICFTRFWFCCMRYSIKFYDITEENWLLRM